VVIFLVIIKFLGGIEMSDKVKEQFEKEFYEEEFELLVLTSEECKGAIMLDNKYINPSVDFVASIDCKTGKLIKSEGRLTWLIKDEKSRNGYGYDFEKYGIYKVLVRKSIPIKLDKYQSEIWNNRFMLVKLLEKDVLNKDLQKLKEYYLKPVILENDMGTFTLNRYFSWFECNNVDWNGADILIYLEVDENCDETANSAMATLLKYAKDKQGFDQKNREFAAKELLDLANDWLEDNEDEDKPDKITKEMFIDNIKMSELCISPDGSITLFYDDGDMFWGHTIQIIIDENGNYDSADIAG